MPMARTHISFVSKLSGFDKSYLYSGAIFPDYFSFTKIHLNKHHELFTLLKNNDGLMFGKRMLKLAKTKEEKAFTIGFISHFILDKHFHNYFDKQKVSTVEEHLSIESFYDTNFKNIQLKYIIIPKGLLDKTLNKYYSKEIKSKVSYIELITFVLYLKTIQKEIIDNKHTCPKWSYIDLIAPFIYKTPICLKKITAPDFSLKSKHLNNLKKEFRKSEIELQKILSKLN
ncbi:MAG: zinc dependent phospholipase C family protein [archaeon]|jgi:hypothetical protein